MSHSRRRKKLSQPGMLAVAVALLSPVVAFGQGYASSTLPRDLSLWGMYVSADPVVKAQADKALNVFLTPDLRLFVGNDPISRDHLGAALDAASKGDKGILIRFLADRTVSYGDVMEVLGLLRAAGYQNIALVGK